MKITKIKMTGYCDSVDHSITDTGIFIAKKVRPTDINGVYKATEAYEVELSLNDKEVKQLIKEQSRYDMHVSSENVVECLREKGFLPNERLLLFREQWYYDWVNKHGFWPDHVPNIRTNTGKLIVFAISDFVKCKLTKKEQDMINTSNMRDKMQGFNNMVVVDDIVKTLNDNHYQIDFEKANQWRKHDALFFHDKKAFNKLIKDSIEYYLNNIVLKEIGCNIKIPEQKTTHGYKYDDVLCYVGDITLNQGE